MKYRYLLFPFSLLYAGAILLRHYLYSVGVVKVHKFDFPLICVGNLSFGGTGKTPMIEYIAELLEGKYKTGILSRGYGRKTKGFVLADLRDDARTIGDEPLQYRLKFPNIQVAVDTDRVRGANMLISSLEVLLLDDAMQHRAIYAGLNILLTTYSRPYFQDKIIPVGTLRDLKGRAQTAQIIIITKCPERLSAVEKSNFTKNINPLPTQRIFFSYISYSNKLLSLEGEMSLKGLKEKFTLVTGIENPQPLIKFLKSRNFDFEHLRFPDHHFFSDKDIQNFNSKKIIITTEKDYMRMRGRVSKSYYLPIRMIMVGEQEEKALNQIILEYVESKSKNNQKSLRGGRAV